MGLYSRAHLERIISENGHSNCHYCSRQTRIRYIGPQERDHATIDHKVPKSKGGTNDPENLLLACSECNNAKGDRSYEDFVARPYRLPAPERSNNSGDGKSVRIRYGNRVIVPVCKAPKNPTVHPAYKARKGTLAAAINSGAVTEYGMYQGTPARELQGEPQNRIEPVPYHETMWILTGKKVPKMRDLLEKR